MFTRTLRTLIVAVAAAGLGLVAPATALGDTRAPSAQRFHVECENGISFDAVSPTERSVVGQVVNSRMVAILAARGIPSDKVVSCDAFIDGEFIFTLPLLLTPQG